MPPQVLTVLALLFKAGVCGMMPYHGTAILVCPVPQQQLEAAAKALPSPKPQHNDDAEPLPNELYRLNVTNG